MNLSNFVNLSKNEAESYLDELSNAYYSGNPLVNDDEFDLFYETYSKKYPNSKYLDKVGTFKEDNKVILPVYLGSLNKIKPETREFDKFVKEINEIIISEKLDGISILIEKKGNNITAYTRGNGILGQDVSQFVTHLVPEIKSDKILVRGELIIPKKYGKDTINLRNMVSGLVNSKKPRLDILQQIVFKAYSLPNSELPPDKQFDLLTKIGFNTPRYQTISIPEKNKDIFFSNLLKDWRESSDYEIDGIVLSYLVSEKIIEGKNPKFSKAFKTILLDQIAETEVINIQWNITKDNLLKPVLVTKPVCINNTTIQKVTAYNAEFLEKSKIGIGSKIQIIKSGDVIPKIHKVLSYQPMSWPIYKWEWDSSKKNIIILDKSANKHKLLHHFVKTIGAKYISYKICEKLVEYNIDTPEKLLDTTSEDLLFIPGFQETSSIKIIDSINNGIKKCDLATLIVATNCLGGNFSSSRIKLCITHLGNNFLDNDLTQLKKELLGIKGFNEKLVNSLILEVPNFLKYIKENYNIRQLYLDKIKIPILKKQSKNTKFTGTSICFSGVRDKNLQEYLVSLGCEIKNNITFSLNYLIVKDITIESSKVTSAKSNGFTKIISIDDAKKYFNSY